MKLQEDFTLVIDPRALRDIQEGIDYYDEQQAGLGEHIVDFKYGPHAVFHCPCQLDCDTVNIVEDHRILITITAVDDCWPTWERKNPAINMDSYHISSSFVGQLCPSNPGPVGLDDHFGHDLLPILYKIFQDWIYLSIHQHHQYFLTL